MSSGRAPIYAGAALLAALVAVALVLASQLGSRTASTRQPTAVFGAADSEQLLAGIPQSGNVLGSPKAPVTLVEYADLQCPYCGEFARNVLPSLVSDYVRTGHVKLVFRGLAFVGPDSVTALRAVVAAGDQHRLWSVAHLIYVNQGTENTGWVTDGFLRSVAGAVAGVDVDRLVAEAASPRTTAAMSEDARLATGDGIQSTPSFLVGRTGKTLSPLVVHALDVDAFRPALDALLSS
jgi:protein-disulfide isomerase